MDQFAADLTKAAKEFEKALKACSLEDCVVPRGIRAISYGSEMLVACRHLLQGPCVIIEIRDGRPPSFSLDGHIGAQSSTEISAAQAAAEWLAAIQPWQRGYEIGREAALEPPMHEAGWKAPSDDEGFVIIVTE